MSKLLLPFTPRFICLTLVALASTALGVALYQQPELAHWFAPMLLLTGLLALTPKWPVRPRVVSFSLDRDTEIVIRALGGIFHTFERNVPTGCNPLQREATPERIAFWTELVKQCIASPEMPLLPNEHESIARAVAPSR